MKKQTFYLGALAIAALSLASCSNDDDDVQPEPRPTIVSTTAANINADAGNTGKFTLFSFADNKVIPNTDSATTKWDIGFRATTIIINGGTSGPGNAQAQVLTGVYNDLTAAPEAGYAADGATKAITGWYNYNMSTHIISPVTGKFFVIKTATGKYVKAEVTSYYKDAPASPTQTSESRYYHFRYVYQADGSRNFK